MFLNILEGLMSERGLNKHSFSQQSKIPYKTIDNFWKKGCDNIKLSTLKKIADFFGVTLDYLIFGKESHGNNEQILEMQKYYNILNNDGRKKAVDYLEDLAGNPKYTNANKTSIGAEIADDIKSIINMPTRIGTK